VQQPDSEAVLVQGRSAGQTCRNDPEIRQAVSQVASALARLAHSATDIESPLTSAGTP
jgi:hypothetical protein